MPRIRFVAVASTHLTFAPGDEILVNTVSQELTRLLNSTRIDGSRVAHVVRETPGDETPERASDEESAEPRRRSTSRRSSAA